MELGLNSFLALNFFFKFKNKSKKFFKASKTNKKAAR